MMPPHCKLCKKSLRTHSVKDFKLISFKLTDEEAEKVAKIKADAEKGRVVLGHPPGRHWFCLEHAKLVSEFKHLTWAEAKKIVTKEKDEGKSEASALTAANVKSAPRRRARRSYQFTHALCREPSRSVVKGLRLENMGNPDYTLMCRQHDIYVEALKEAGVIVNILAASEDFPDSIFVEDAALVLDGVAILMQPGANSRAGEPEILVQDGKQWFKDIVNKDLGGSIDGGDILCFDDVVLVGMSERTSEAGADSLASIVADFGYELRKVRTPKDILHFKSHCSLLDEKTAIATKALAASGCFKGFDVVVVPDDEPQGSNVIRVNDKVIMSAEAPKTIAMLKEQGYDVLPVPTTEVAKIDGAVSCCSLRYVL